MPVAYEELAGGGLEPNRNREIFWMNEWMNNIYYYYYLLLFNNNNNNIIYSIYRALIPNGPKALYIIKITTKS